MRKLIIIVILMAVSFSMELAQAETERILTFSSDITVHPDASMTVTETIRIVALGDQIKRGIYRDFPTKYQDRHGNKFNVDFKVLEVTRDGNFESYFTRLSLIHI